MFKLFDGTLEWTQPAMLMPWLRLVLVRMLPFGVWAAFAKRPFFGYRILVIIVTGAVAYVTFHSPAGSRILLGLSAILVYFLAVASGVYLLGPHIRSALVFAGALVMLMFVVPAYAHAANPEALAIAVVTGWDLSLASYSFFRERFQRGLNRTFDEYLFFLFVNPEVVYPPRAVESPPSLKGLARASFGAGLMFAVLAMPQRLDLSRPPVEIHNAVHGVSYGGSAFVLIYAAHSALAHFQIGMCRLIGYKVPERYTYPFIAANLQDFWSRWNTYVGDWLRVYVYAPVWRSLAGSKLVPAEALAIFSAFTIAGTMHAFCASLIEGRFTGKLLAAFTVWGICVLIGINLKRLTSKCGRWLSSAARVVGRIALALTIVVNVWMFV